MSYHTRLEKDLNGAAAAGLLSPEQAAERRERSCPARAFSSFSVAAKGKTSGRKLQLLDLVKKI